MKLNMKFKFKCGNFVAVDQYDHDQQKARGANSPLPFNVACGGFCSHGSI